MLYNIIFAFVIIFSIAVIVFIISKKMPLAEIENRIKRKEEKSVNVKKRNWKFSYRQIMHIFIHFCERIFRIIKIWALKLDNVISKWLKKLNNLKKKNDFSKERVEQDTLDLINEAEKVNFSQLKNTTPRPQIQSNINIARMLGEKEKKEKQNEAIVEVDDVDLFTEKECIEMITKNPRNIRAYHTLADIYIKQKNFDDAKASLQQILKFDANNVEAKLKLRKLRQK